MARGPRTDKVLGQRITDPNTLVHRRLYKVRTSSFNQVNLIPVQAAAFTSGPPVTRNMYFLNVKTMAGYPNIYRFLDVGTNQIYQVFYRWPRQLLRHLAMMVTAQLFPPGTFNHGINVWLNVRGYFDVTHRLYDMGRAL